MARSSASPPQTAIVSYLNLTTRPRQAFAGRPTADGDAARRGLC